jgi:hypothetical protein
MNYIPCKNAIVCKGSFPKEWVDYNGCTLCTDCECRFGRTLTLTKEQECPICLEDRPGVQLSKCEHSICIPCFQRCYYGEESHIGEPMFPYPQLEEEYKDNPYHKKWRNYILIQIYREEYETWNYKNIDKYMSEGNLRRCPLCRN